MPHNIFISSPLQIRKRDDGYTYAFSIEKFHSGTLTCAVIYQNKECRRKLICGIPEQPGILWKENENFERVEWEWNTKNQAIARFPFAWHHRQLGGYGMCFENLHILGNKMNNGYLHCTWLLTDNRKNMNYAEWIEVTWRWLVKSNQPIRAILCIKDNIYPVGARCINGQFIEWRTYWKCVKKNNILEWIFELPPDTHIEISKMAVSYRSITFYSEPIQPNICLTNDSVYTSGFLQDRNQAVILDILKCKNTIDTDNIHIRCIYQHSVLLTNFYENILAPSFITIPPANDFIVGSDIEQIKNTAPQLICKVADDAVEKIIPADDAVEKIIPADEITHEVTEEKQQMPAILLYSADELILTSKHLYCTDNWEKHTIEYTQTPPLITVIILFRGNNISLLRRCLWSLYHQTLSPEKFDICIGLDGNKTIRFSDIRSEIPNQLRVHIYSFLKWKGICWMNRYMLERARGSCIGWVDHDDTLDKTCLERVVQLYNGYSYTGIFVYTNFYKCDRNGKIQQEGGGRQPRQTLLEEQCGNHFRTIPSNIRNKLPVFPDDLKFGAEDQDLLFLTETLCHPKCITEPLYFYHQNTADNLSQNISINTWLLQWCILRNVYYRSTNNYKTIITIKHTTQERSNTVFELVYSGYALRLFITNERLQIPLKISQEVLLKWTAFFHTPPGQYEISVSWEGSSLSWIPSNNLQHWSSPNYLAQSQFAHGVFPGGYWDLVILWKDGMLDAFIIDFGNLLREEWGCKVEIWGAWDWSDQLKIHRRGAKSLFWHFRSWDEEVRVMNAQLEWRETLLGCASDWKVQFYCAHWEGCLENETNSWALDEYNNLTGIDLHLLGLDFHAWEWLYTWISKETDGKIQYGDFYNVIFDRLRLRYQERRKGEVWFHVTPFPN